ncbi:MAG: sensor domain-containing diguanylate cyclase [Solirubrobacteraceae bacterium]
MLDRRNRDQDAVATVRRAADERFRAAFDQAGIAMGIVPLQGASAGRLIAVNGAYAKLLGFEPDELLGRNAEGWTHAEDLRESLDDPLAAVAAGTADRVQYEARFIDRDGRIVWASVTAAGFCDEDGVKSAIVQVVDISERKGFEARLQYQADHDPLTGAFNRRRFDEELHGALARARRYGNQGALLALDLDGFKFVNDSLGHGAGDELVVRLCQTIREALRDSDVLARTGGDEFAVLLPEADEDTGMTVALRLLDAIRQRGTIVRGNVCAQVTTSVGVTTFDGLDGTTAEDLLVEADIAMYEAKAAGKDRARAYRRESARRAQIATRQGWLTRLRDAIAGEQLILFAQPIVALCAPNNNRFELLVRMPGEDDSPACLRRTGDRADLVGEPVAADAQRHRRRARAA